MLTGEYIAGATHVCGKLIDLIESAVHDGATKSLVPQVAHHEIVGVGLRELVKFQIYPANPKPVILQSFDKMAADEPAGAADQRTFHHQPLAPCQERVGIPTWTSQHHDLFDPRQRSPNLGRPFFDQRMIRHQNEEIAATVRSPGPPVNAAEQPRECRQFTHTPVACQFERSTPRPLLALYQQCNIRAFRTVTVCACTDENCPDCVQANLQLESALVLGFINAISAYVNRGFGWPEAVIQICPNGSDLTAVLSDLDSDPERIAAISRRNAKEALLRHDWVYRWNEMFRVAGIEPSPHMAARERHLKDMADFVASAKKKADTAPKSRTDPAGDRHK
jgi:hypothetical protein